MSTPQFWQKPDSNWNLVLTADVVEFDVAVAGLFEVNGAEEEGEEEEEVQVCFLAIVEQHFMVNILIEKRNILMVFKNLFNVGDALYRENLLLYRTILKIEKSGCFLDPYVKFAQLN